MGKGKVVLLLLLLTPFISSYELCDERISETQLEILEVTDESQSSQTYWEWKPTESVTINVDMINKNFTTRNFKLDLQFLDGSLRLREITTASANPSKTISLPEDETISTNFTFTLNEPNLDTYYLYAKLYDPNNESICTSLKATSQTREATVNILPEEKIIVVKKITGPENLTLENQVQYEAEVVNLGNKKEDQVLIVMYNLNLDLRQEIVIKDLEVQKTRTVKFNLTLPSNTTSKEEILLFVTQYDYDNRTDFYSKSADKPKIFQINIDTTPPETIQNQTQETQAQQNQTQEETQAQTSGTTMEQIQGVPYLIPTIITIITIIILISAAFIIVRYKRRDYIVDPEESTSTAASDYVKKIQNSS